MMRIRAAQGWTALLPAVFAGALFLTKSSPGDAAAPIAVIVHEQVPVDELSLPELRQIFLGKRLFWSGDLTITLLVPPRGSREREVLLNRIYEQRSEGQYKRYWIQRLFSDGARTTPKISGSPKMSWSLVRGIPGAIALVPADRIPQGVKVLRIDGKHPKETGYPLVPSG